MAAQVPPAPTPFLPTLSVGMVHVMPFTVAPSQCVNRFGIPGGEVLSTPQMLDRMEWSCVELAEQHLVPGMASVGIEVELKHLAAAKLGDNCACEARIVAFKGNKITFEITAKIIAPDGSSRVMGTCTHKRAVIPIPR